MKKLLFFLFSCGLITMTHAEQDWGPMPYPTPVNEPSIRDFTAAAKMLTDTAGSPAYIDKLTTYRMCTELAVRALQPQNIQPVGELVYRGVRNCTRQMDEFVLIFVLDERYKANYYVAHAIQRLTQQDQMDDLLPLASRIRSENKLPTHFWNW